MPSLKKHAENLAQVIELFRKSGHELRFVGGCVRDALVGITPKDIDLASTMPANEALALLRDHHITSIPTGLDHGTITVVIQYIPYQITTLRKDIDTYGRRAKVHFTDDWQEDAARRDFTMNALYRDFEGNIYDYFEGRKDLNNGIVRFIGDPEQRIVEDYLRILRLFRFYARFGKLPINEETLRICQKHSDKLSILSVERITQEILNLLHEDNCLKSLILMDSYEILQKIFATFDLKRLEQTLQREKEHNLKHDPLRRLAALSDDIHALRLSKNQHHYLNLVHKVMSLNGAINDQQIPLLCVQYGKKILVDYLIIYSPKDEFSKIEYILSLHIPHFPIKGQDIIDRGHLPGPMIKQYLERCLEWWCENNFVPDKNDCLNYVESLDKG